MSLLHFNMWHYYYFRKHLDSLVKWQVQPAHDIQRNLYVTVQTIFISNLRQRNNSAAKIHPSHVGNYWYGPLESGRYRFRARAGPSRTEPDRDRASRRRELT